MGSLARKVKLHPSNFSQLPPRPRSPGARTPRPRGVTAPGAKSREFGVGDSTHLTATWPVPDGASPEPGTARPEGVSKELQLSQFVQDRREPGHYKPLVRASSRERESMSTELLAVLVVLPTAAVVVALFVMLWSERTSARTSWVAVVSGFVLSFAALRT